MLEAGCLNLRVKRIIQMFHFGLVVLSVLVYRHWLLPVVRYWLLPVNSPTAGHIWKHVFPKGSNDRYTVGEFFQLRFLPIFFKTRCASKKKNTLKTKVANTKCRLFATILMHPAGLSWFKIMRPLWEACVWDPGRAGKKSLHIVEIYETDYNRVTHLIRLLGLVHRLVLGHLHGNFQVKLHL